MGKLYLGNEFALVDVQVGAADTAGLDLDLVGSAVLRAQEAQDRRGPCA
jgi:hypothetical protein